MAHSCPQCGLVILEPLDGDLQCCEGCGHRWNLRKLDQTSSSVARRRIHQDPDEWPAVNLRLPIGIETIGEQPTAHVHPEGSDDNAGTSERAVDQDESVGNADQSLMHSANSLAHESQINDSESGDEYVSNDETVAGGGEPIVRKRPSNRLRALRTPRPNDLEIEPQEDDSALLAIHASVESSDEFNLDFSGFEGITDVPPEPPVTSDDHQSDQFTVFKHIQDEIDRSEDDSGAHDHSSGTQKVIDTLIGETVDGYLIEQKVGAGGMGAVFRARQLSLDRTVALKIIPPDLLTDKKFLRRFEQEAKALARINHSNILHVYDFGTDGERGLYYMVIEYVEGSDLSEVLKQDGKISQEQALDIVRQTAVGLRHAYAKGVVHRDIKPDNLMLTQDGTCKVADFGLAKDIASDVHVTNSGSRVGTPAFMSPEQCDGGLIDHRSDMYSLGVTLYVMLTGYLPFHADSPFAIMLKHKNDPIPSIKRRSPEVHPQLDQIIQRLMAKMPRDRYDTYDDLIEAVDESVDLIQRRESDSLGGQLSEDSESGLAWGALPSLDSDADIQDVEPEVLQTSITRGNRAFSQSEDASAKLVGVEDQPAKKDVKFQRAESAERTERNESAESVESAKSTQKDISISSNLDNPLSLSPLPEHQPPQVSFQQPPQVAAGNQPGLAALDRQPSPADVQASPISFPTTPHPEMPQLPDPSASSSSMLAVPQVNHRNNEAQQGAPQSASGSRSGRAASHELRKDSSVPSHPSRRRPQRRGYLDGIARRDVQLEKLLN